MSKTDTNTWPLVSHNQPNASDRHTSLSTLRPDYNNEHHVGKDSTVSGTNGETLPKVSKVNFFNSVECYFE